MSMENQKFDPQEPIAASKQQWRLRLKKIREELSMERSHQGSVKACQVLEIKCQKAHFVLSFASFGSEINLWALNQKLCEERRLVLPLVTKERELLLFHVTDLSQLKPHTFGMLEPQSSICDPINPSLIEIALIPGLGFDLANKHRLGYGGGSYDKLLKSNGIIKKWGIGFLEQGAIHLPFIDKDVALDEIFLF